MLVKCEYDESRRVANDKRGQFYNAFNFFLSDNAMEDDDIRVFPVFIEKYRFLI